MLLVVLKQKDNCNVWNDLEKESVSFMNNVIKKKSDKTQSLVK